MLRFIRTLALLAAAGLAANVVADDKPGAKDKGGDEAKMVPAGQVTGVLMSPGSDKGDLVVRVPYNYLEPTLWGRRITYSVRQAHRDYELKPADDMKVRLANPPAAFDEKGKPKRYTAKELKELKGEGNLPGYQAGLESLRANQVVTVYLSAKKRAAPPKKGKELDKETLEESKPVVRMVVIMAEPRN
jgi:hypothetical protein